MLDTTRYLVVLAVVAGVALLSPAHATADDFVTTPSDSTTDGVTRTQLQRLPAPVTGFDIVQTRFEIPVGMESGMHSHPGPEIGYIIQGDVDMVFDDRPTQRLQPGQPFNIPADTVHNARNVGTTRTLMLSTYVIDVTQPLATER